MNHITKRLVEQNRTIQESEDVIDARSVFAQRQHDVALARSYRRPRSGDSA